MQCIQQVKWAGWNHPYVINNSKCEVFVGWGIGTLVRAGFCEAAFPLAILVGSSDTASGRHALYLMVSLFTDIFFSWSVLRRLKPIWMIVIMSALVNTQYQNDILHLKMLTQIKWIVPGYNRKRVQNWESNNKRKEAR